MVFKFCPRCGDVLIEKVIGDEGLIPFCKICNRPWFSLSYPCVLVLVENEFGELALIKQSYVSAENYVTVAGYIKSGETAENSAMREVEEELGLVAESVTFIKSYYYEKHDNLMLGFVCKVKKTELKISGEVDSANWFSKNEAMKLFRDGSIGQKMLFEYIR